MSSSKKNSLPVSLDGLSPRRRTQNHAVQQSIRQPRHAESGATRSAVSEVELGCPGNFKSWLAQQESCVGCGAQCMDGPGSRPEGCIQSSNTNDSRSMATSKAAQDEQEVPVTSLREIMLGKYYGLVLLVTGVLMVGSALLLLALLLIAWQGFNASLFIVLSPWVAVYLPIPLGLLNGAWSIHCACDGFIHLQNSAACPSCAGICGTAWGCSGPACAVNLGLDFGLMITSLLAMISAAVAPRGCGYQCYVLLCFPCAPMGGAGMACAMTLCTLSLIVGAVVKMVYTWKALTNGARHWMGFLPW